MATIDQQLLNGDKVLNSAGRFYTVTGEAKLAQDLSKIVLTDLYSNPFHSEYGSLLTDKLVGSGISIELSATIIESTVRNAVLLLQDLQQQQKQEQNVGSNEVIGEIIRVEVEQLATDPRQFNAKIDVITEERKAIEVQFVIAV